MTRQIEPVPFSGKSLHRKLWRSIVLTLLLLGTPTAITLAYDVSLEPLPALEPGKAIAQVLGGGEKHYYQLTLLAGQYVRILAEQQRINVALAAFNPDGKKVVEADGFPMGNPERLMFIAETSGTYRVEVRSPDQTAHKGNYEIKIRYLRAATEHDKNHVVCDSLMNEGLLLYQQPTTESVRNAIEKYQQSIPFCQAAKEPSWEATDFYLIAGAYSFLRDKQKALDFANQALPIAEAAVNQSGEEDRRLGIKVKANALSTIAGIHNEFGDRKQALENFKLALPLSRAIEDPVGELNALTSIGAAYNDIGDYHKSLDYFNQSIVISRNLGDRLREGNLLNNICVVHNQLGDHKRAMDFCTQALSVRREHKFEFGEAVTLSNMGNIYSDSGQYQKSLDFYTQAHALYKQAGSPQGQGITLNNIGFLYAILGDYEKAIHVYNQSLDIFRTAHDQFREANVLGNIASSYAKLKEFRKALEINEQALGLHRLVGNQASEANTLTNIADCYSSLGGKHKGLEYLNQSLALHRTVGDPRRLAKTLKSMGALYLDLGQPQKALDYFNEGLELTRAIGDRNGEAATLSEIARLERDGGNLVQARKRIEESLAAIESLRVSVKSQQLRASFVASVRKYYEFDVDVLMRLHQLHPSEGFDAAALAASEKSRARSLLELLAEANAEIRQGVDSQLLERERQLRAVIADKAERQTRMLSGKHTDEQAKVAGTEIDSLTTEYEQVVARIRETSPRYAGLTQPLPLDLKQIQTEVLDPDTLLLEYSLGEDRSFLWAVTQNSIKSFELQEREVLEAAARRFYEELTERNRVVKNETPEQRRLRLDRSDAEYANAATALSELLLQPVASQLGAKRLVIIGEGLLQYVPFAGLPIPVDQRTNQADKGNTSTTYRPLILEHEI